MEADYQSSQFALDILSFFFDRWEFLIGILLGVSGTYISVVIKKKYKTDLRQKGDGNQGTQIIESPNSNPQSAQRDAMRQEGVGGVMATVNNSPGATVNIAPPRTASSDEALGPTSIQTPVTAVSLDVNQAHILNKVQEVLTRLSISSSFSGRYQNAINHLNNNSAQVCASEYHSAFLDVVPVLSERSTYGVTAPTPENLSAIDTAFTQIRTFMNGASHDHVALRTQIRAFEDSLLILLGYL